MLTSILGNRSSVSHGEKNGNPYEVLHDPVLVKYKTYLMLLVQNTIRFIPKRGRLELGENFRETFGLQFPRALTHGEAPFLGISKYILLQSFQYKNELLLEFKKKHLSLSLQLHLLLYIIVNSRVQKSWDEVFFKIMKKPSIAQRLEGPL